MRLKSRVKAFTLIEVMIALLILSITLFALTSSQGISLTSTRKAKFITLATIAAKNMITEIDIMSDFKGFEYVKDLGEKTDGEFEDEQYKGWKWTREIKEVNFPLAAIMKTFLAKDEATGESEESKPTGQEEQILGIMATNVEKLMKDSMREVTVTVFWPVKAGKEFSSLRLVYYVVNVDGVQNFVPVM